jgi:hypothetical protein
MLFLIKQKKGILVNSHYHTSQLDMVNPELVPQKDHNTQIDLN